MGRTVGPMGSEQLLDLLEEQHTAAGRGLLVTGAHGAGKTRMLRAASATLQQRGSTAPVLAAHSVGGDVPLGLFLGVADLAVTMLRAVQPGSSMRSPVGAPPVRCWSTASNTLILPPCS